jgi:hypothetical protein
MLYAANIDSNIHQDEVDEILQKIDDATYEKVRKMFKKMSDTEILSCIQENKVRYFVDATEKQRLLDDVHSIIAADGRHSAIEKHLTRVLKKILD